MSLNRLLEAKQALNDRASLYSSASAFNVSGLKSLRRKYGANQQVPSTDQSNNSKSVFECSKLESGGKGNFVDDKGRSFVLKGINVDGASKLPTRPNLHSYDGNSEDKDGIFFEGDKVSFVGRPFPLGEATDHFTRIKSWGYNVVRYLLTWEAIEHEGPGIYDNEFIDYTIKVLEIIGEIGGLYVILEFHQDVWSRFTGGSGAPMWTLYAAGLEPKRFSYNEAAVLHNESRFQMEDGVPYPKMLWTTNYNRLSSLVMFTLFFSGKNYFPDLVINGKNIQDYLQDHFYGSMEQILKALSERLPELVSNGTILGFESLNEPNRGLMGRSELDSIPESQQLRLDTTPTPYQTMKLGMGFPCMIDVYKISVVGPQKYGTKLVDPMGLSAWLSPDEAKTVDEKYKWKRDPRWKIGKCIFAQRNIWSWTNDIDLKELTNLTIQQRLDFGHSKCKLIQPNYFSEASLGNHFDFKDGKGPSKIDLEYFINHNYVDFYLRHKACLRKYIPDCFSLMQAPVLEVPPMLKNDPRDVIDAKTVYSPHYYDGMSLLFKTWNTKYNVDTLGIMRERYYNPVLGIVFGERAIRNCIKKQFNEIREESMKYLGNIPVLMSETGMPFDMNDKKAFEDGKYQSQTAAIDALSYALEGSNMSHTYWCYTSVNCHKWGDRWNNEDFSFWSPEDRKCPLDYEFQSSNKSSNRSSRRSSIRGIDSLRSAKNRRKKNNNLLLPSMRGESSTENEWQDDTEEENNSSLISTDIPSSRHGRKCYPSPDGVRAVNAVIRPYVIAACGIISSSEFDLKSVKFSLTIMVDKDAVDLKHPTVIFLPRYHFPALTYDSIYLTYGHVKYNEKQEYLEWYLDDEERTSDVPSSRTSTLEKVREETIIVRSNNSNNLSSKDRRGLLSTADELNCPVT